MATKPKAASVAKAPAPEAAPDVVPPAEAVATEVVAAEAVATEVVATEVVATEVVAPKTVIAAPEAPEVPAVAVETVSIIPSVTVKRPMEKVVKTAEEFVAFGQGNVEAIAKSSQIWVAGVQDLSKQVAATAQAQFDETMSIFKAMSSVKSLKDMFELQSTYAKAAMEKTMSESGKLTDASLKLAEQALAPITARVTTAVESFSKAA
jgi:phasin family protein